MYRLTFGRPRVGSLVKGDHEDTAFTIDATTDEEAVVEAQRRWVSEIKPVYPSANFISLEQVRRIDWRPE